MRSWSDTMALKWWRSVPFQFSRSAEYKLVLHMRINQNIVDIAHTAAFIFIALVFLNTVLYGLCGEFSCIPKYCGIVSVLQYTLQGGACPYGHGEQGGTRAHLHLHSGRDPGSSAAAIN